MSRMVTQLEAVPGDGLNGHQHFAGILASSRDFGRENPDHMRTLLAWMASGFRASQGEPFVAYQQLVARLFKLIVGVVERGKADGSIRPELDAHQVMMSMWGGTMGMWLLYFSREEIARRTPTPVDFDLLLPGFQAMLLRAIRAEGAGGDDDT